MVSLSVMVGVGIKFVSHLGLVFFAVVILTLFFLYFSLHLCGRGLISTFHFPMIRYWCSLWYSEIRCRYFVYGCDEPTIGELGQTRTTHITYLNAHYFRHLTSIYSPGDEKYYPSCHGWCVGHLWSYRCGYHTGIHSHS